MPQILLKRGSGAPPTLANGEPAWDSVGHTLYVGDGVTNTAIGSAPITVHEFTFAFGDSTPAVLFDALAGKVVTQVILIILTPFDGVGAELSVGDAGDSERLMAIADNDPTEQATYSTCPGVLYGSDTGLLLTIDQGAGASQGNGLLIVHTQS